MNLGLYTEIILEIIIVGSLILIYFLPVFLFLCHSIFFIDNANERLNKSLLLLLFTWIYLPVYFFREYLPLKKSGKGLSELFNHDRKK
jgi:hypothetical protein